MLCAWAILVFLDNANAPVLFESTGIDQYSFLKDKFDIIVDSRAGQFLQSSVG